MQFPLGQKIDCITVEFYCPCTANPEGPKLSFYLCSDWYCACVCIWSCNLEKEQFCFELWHNQYTGWMLTLDGSLAHSNIAIWLPGKGCCGRPCCAFDSSLSQGSSSLMNTRGLFSNDSKVEFESKIWRKQKNWCLDFGLNNSSTRIHKKRAVFFNPPTHPKRKLSLILLKSNFAWLLQRL